ncbi:hypothetical protein AG1IA_05535 [Rhizoctonia solani AG-1 IA]|uniref:Uncharacterized protein n=1 Tax=Thanatephorus cucumeris (strain AG1-IA) TaxID=983506 RepID=L8WQL8_THACA|nr:hypothetical protein AG1IA_05535 [Rhizoctonia solani AG-1 IA]
MEGGNPHESTLITSLRNLPSQSRVVDTTDPLSRKQLDFISKFPLEIFGYIADHLFAATPPQKNHHGSIHSTKPPFSTVRGFMSASRPLHDMGMLRWVYLLTIRDSGDWEVVLKMTNSVRELICLDGALDSGNQSVLNQFPHLHTVSINAHEDVYKNASGRFSYRDVFNLLPTSILRLEITCAHGPDLSIMRIVRDHCPNIEVLRLGRCTMFNRIPACEFWLGFPFEHDAYIASHGIEDYAHSVAQEIVSLRRLKQLRLGVYLVPSATVLAHRAYHLREVAAPVPVNWQQALIDSGQQPAVNEPPDEPLLIEFYHRDEEAESKFGPDTCSFCRDGFYEQSRALERSASAVMKAMVPSLESVEWMDWFSPYHLGVSRCDVGPGAARV